MMDQQGNVETTKVYFAQVGMSRASQVNWENLMGVKDMVGAVENNFDTVWWHPGVMV